jgi:hypothetical protein
VGGAAAIQQTLGINPFHTVSPVTVTVTPKGTVRINNAPLKKDMFIRADSSIKTRKKPLRDSTANEIDVPELKRICKHAPKILFIGVTRSKPFTVTKEAHTYLTRKGIDYVIKPVAAAVILFNNSPRRKALILQHGPKI